MRFVSIVLCIASIFTARPARALDIDEIYKFDVCKGVKSHYSDQEVGKLVESSRDFPSSFSRLGGYVDYVQKYNSSAAKLSCPLQSAEKVPPHPVLEALTAVTMETASLMATDIENQRKLVEKAAVCSAIWAKKWGDNETTPKASAEMFKEQAGKSPSPQECTDFVNKLVPQLKFRYKRMRQYLVLAKPDTVLDLSLSHDRPFSSFIGEKFVGSVWKTDGSLSRLSQTEIDELPGLKNITTQSPMDLYYQIISTTPMLLFFTDAPTPKTISQAFQNLKKQTQVDSTELITNPPQEIMLYTAYVTKAIEKLPMSQRGEACQAVKEIYRNLKFRYEGIPQLLNIATLALSVPRISKIATAGVKAAFMTFANRVGIGAATVSADQAVNNLLIYIDGVTMCSRIAMEKNMNPSVDGLCNIEKVNEKFTEAQTNVVVGASILGATRVVTPALTTRAVSQAAKTAEAEAAKKAAREFQEAGHDIH